ncbi:MAG: tail fiber domain-containing protein [Thermodesulfovibrionales bacterium]
MKKNVVMFCNLIAAVLCIVGSAWGAPIEGTSNTALGMSAGSTLGAGELQNGINEYDTFIGANAGFINTASGIANTFVGERAGYQNTSGSSNIFLGYRAGYFNGVSNFNSYFGNAAGYTNDAPHNSIFGYRACFSGPTGPNNTFLGYQAGYSGGSDSSGGNVFIGADSGYYQHGTRNTYVGRSSGHSSTPGGTGSDNSFLGYQAGFFNFAGGNNVGLGYQAGLLNTAGSANVFIGPGAGYSETNSNKLYIDNCFTGETPPGSNLFCVQPLIAGDFNDRLVHIDGSLNIVDVSTPSDVRYKKDIHPLEASLEKVVHLQGVSYAWDKDKVSGAGYGGGRQIGLIAQDVERLLPELVHTDSKGYKTLSYDKLVPVLIEAVKERQQQIMGRHALHKKEMAEQKDRFEQAIDEKNAEITYLKQTLEGVTARLAVIENSGKTVASK